jgi:carboxyl-terminal processing protease
MAARLGILLLAMACAAPAAGDRSLTPAQRQLNLDSFDRVWTTVREKYWDPQLGGLDWQAARQELRPKIEAAATMEQAREVLSALLARLRQSHFAIIPAQSYEELDGGGAERQGNPGIDVRMVGGRAMVSAVAPGSPAAARGVRPGWEITGVEGKEIAPAVAAIRESMAGSTMIELLQARSVTARLSGRIGAPVSVSFREGSDRSLALELDRSRPRGTPARLGNLPEMNFWVESRRVRPEIGYIRFNLFFEPETLIRAFREMVTGCGECRGLVIDLRGNPGGIGGLATGVAGWFIGQPGQQLGAMQTRDTRVNFAVFPRPEPFRGPLAILVDACSASTSEIFAEGMKDLGRARIFGTRTAGAALPSVFEKLPNGDGFQYAIASYVSFSGKSLEGAGVIPDEEIGLARRDLLEGRDAVLEAAVSWIEQRKN